MSRVTALLRAVVERASNLFGAAERRRELDDEMGFHLEQLARRFRNEGMTPDEAVAAARKQFGSMLHVREQVHDESGIRPLFDFGTDVRLAARQLARRPAYAVAAIGTIAIGIGALSTLLTVGHGILVRPLPLPEPDRLYVLWGTVDGEDTRFGNASDKDLSDWNTGVSSWAELAGFSADRVELGGAADPDLVIVGRVTPDFFRLLGTTAIRGRIPEPAELRAGDRTVVVDEGAWRRRFGEDPAIVGRSLRLGEAVYSVVGVTKSPGIRFPSDAEFWTPLTGESHRGSRSLNALGRLGPEADVETAQAELETIAGDLAAAFPDSNANRSVRPIPLQEHLVGDARPVLSLFLMAALLVFLVTCVNTGTLAYAASAERTGDLAVRRALGAGRFRLLRHLITESALTSGLGATAGLAGGAVALRWLTTRPELSLPRLDTIRTDGMSLLFAGALALVAAVAVGLGPALRASRPAWLTRALREATAGKQTSVRTDALIALQIAATFALLFGAGIMLRSLWTLQQVDPGLDPDGVVTFRVTLPAARYTDLRSVADFHAALDAGLRAEPATVAVGAIAVLPFSPGSLGDSYAIDGDPVRDDSPTAQLRGVLGSYFEATGMRVAEGTGFADVVGTEEAPVAVVNRALAAQAWPGQSPIGRTITHFGAERTVVGVVENVRAAGLDQAAVPTVYVPFLQRPTRFMTYVVDAAALPEAAIAAARAAVREIDPELPLQDVATLASQLRGSFGDYRTRALLLLAMGLTALVLATVGLYGLAAQAVAAQRREIGIRMALGAASATVRREVVAHGLRRVLLGVGVGATLCLMLQGLLEAFAYGVDGGDPATLAATAITLTVVGLAGCWIPGRRAARVEPTEALRVD